MEDLAREIEAIRLRAALSQSPHVRVLRFSGPDAFDVVDRLSTAELPLADGRVRPSLLLHADGTIFADLFVCRDGYDLLWLVEGPTDDALDAFVRAETPTNARCLVTNVSATHDLLSLHGPYAAEVAAEVAGKAVLDLQALARLRFEGGTCLRARKTGEYGYHLLVPRERTAEVRRHLLAARTGLEPVVASVEALDHCALEDFVFNARREGACGLTPLELRLEGRVDLTKEAVGVPALRTRRSSLARLATCVVGRQPMVPGDSVRFEERHVGRILVADPSWTRGGWVGIALLDVPLARPGLRMTLAGTLGDRPIDTIAPPLVNNRSRAVDPRRHTWASRGPDDLPPL